MATRRNKMSQRKKYKGTKSRRQKGKRWVTALQAGEKTLKTTGSLKKARETLRSQALLNAGKLFGSIGRTL
jgi:hypothetical protein